MFRLKIPNQEVKVALGDQLVNAYTDFVEEKLGIQRPLYAEVLNVKKVVIKIAQNILKFGQPISKY
ncbi:hypothetical protein CEP14_15815 [Cylindrospermopsis raciborskii C04]|uniref:Uncharacterized protein n=2 Tax=Cylindrospermopsis raciborskii TaxID=77022 RepID=A0ABX4WJ01_9CYAN|nr:hypothetical protein CEP14_15815 [Cylindrospermopsis raciborskii C04]PNJ92830.1 hypothetical protein CEP13_14415 [Cylindrospermopsis raciborskii C03]PNJ93735.1 hypothetical protein CEP15_14060 [Cylindrospermopsis raciborskii C07]